MTTDRRTVEIGGVTVGAGAPLCLIAGPCQLETLDHALIIAETMAEAASNLRKVGVGIQVQEVVGIGVPEKTVKPEGVGAQTMSGSVNPKDQLGALASKKLNPKDQLSSKNAKTIDPQLCMGIGGSKDIGVGIPTHLQQMHAVAFAAEEDYMPLTGAGSLHRGAAVRPTGTVPPGAYAMARTQRTREGHHPPSIEEAHIPANSEGLVTANAIDDEENPRSNLPEAHHVDLEQQERTRQERQRKLESKQREEDHQKVAVGVCFLVALVIAVVMPVLLLQGGSSNTEAIKTAAPAITSSTEAPDPKSLVLPLLPNHTLEHLNDPESPQSLALDWIHQDPSLPDYEPFRIHQRFALATLYFATGGTLDKNAQNATDAWQLGTHWLSYDHHECDWVTHNDTADLARFFKPENQPLTPIVEGRPCVGWYNDERNESFLESDLPMGTYQD